MRKTKKHQPVSNPLLAAAMRDLRRSNAAGKHQDKRNRRARTRSTQKGRALKDYR